MSKVTDFKNKIELLNKTLFDLYFNKGKLDLFTFKEIKRILSDMERAASFISLYQRFPLFFNFLGKRKIFINSIKSLNSLILLLSFNFRRIGYN